AEPIVRILFKGEIAAEIPATALADNTPIYHRELRSEPPEYVQKAQLWEDSTIPIPESYNEILLKLLDSPSIASKRWVYRQYDHQVQNNTVILPGGADAAVIRVRPLGANPANSRRGVAATTDCNPRYVYLDPYNGAKLAVAEAARNLSCVGADPIAVTDNLNFGSPENSIGYWQLATACQGIAEACGEMNTPVTGGNVSLYNETVDAAGSPQSIYPTPVIGMVGLVPDIGQICGQGWQKAGDLSYILGFSLPTIGASEYLAVIHGLVTGKPPVIDFELERKVQAACRRGIRAGWVKSAHDCAEGGLATALAECCISGQLGAEIDLSWQHQGRFDAVLFGELASCIIVSVSPENQQDWEEYLKTQLGDYWQITGKVSEKSDNLLILDRNKQPAIDVSLETIQQV
ncbi:MAG: AIR synthase related protein, partial [Microcystis sp.]